MKPNWNSSWLGKDSELQRLIKPFKKVVRKVNKKLRSKSKRTKRSKR